MSEGRVLTGLSGWACEWKSAGICLAGLAAVSATSACGVVIGQPDLLFSRQLALGFEGVGVMEIQEASGSYRGTGVLLNDRWVLTAAHNWDAGGVTGLAFSINGQRHEAAEWIQHPGWDGSFSTAQGWDLGLVRLMNSVAGFGTTKRYAGSSELGMSITVLGAGLSGEAGGGLDANGSGTVFGFTNTIDRVVSLGGPYGSGGLLIYDFDNGLASKNSLAMSAAYDAFGQPVEGSGNILGSGSSATMTSLEGTTALGDSGGPAYADFGNGPELVGIVSWGANPTEPGNLYGSGYGDVGYLMRVSALNGWITGVIPEPGTFMMAAAGMLGFLGKRRRTSADSQEKATVP